MGQCISASQQVSLYCRIPRDLAGSIHNVKQGYSDLLDVDEVKVTKRGIRVMRKLLEHTSFETLSISFCVFKDAQVQEDFASLIRSKECIKYLCFSQNTLHGEETNLTFLIESLRGRQMNEIELNDRSIYGQKGELFLSELLTRVFPERLKLKYMALDLPAIRGLCTGLDFTSCTIKVLTLKECWVDDEMLSLLVDTLCSKTSTVTELNLESNSLSPAALPLLTRLVRENQTLKDLILDRNENLFFGATEEHAADFANAIKTNTTLVNLSLNLTDLGDVVAIPLFRALEHNVTLQALHFDDTFISVDGYAQFVQSLARLNLRNISVGWDDIFDEFPPLLQQNALEALRKNERLLIWNESAMTYGEESSDVLAFIFARNKYMVHARSVLRSLSNVASESSRVKPSTRWQDAVVTMSQEEAGASAVFEILRQRLPATALAASCRKTTTSITKTTPSLPPLLPKIRIEPCTRTSVVCDDSCSLSLSESSSEADMMLSIALDAKDEIYY